MTNMNLETVSRIYTIAMKVKVMMRMWVRLIPGVLALAVLVGVVRAGGWDLVTVRNFPEYAVAGNPLKLTFKVFVPSLEPYKDLHPGVHATNSAGTAETVVRVLASATGATDEFTVTLILPKPGDCVISIDTNYQGALTLPPLKVIAPGTPVPLRLSLEAQGQRLFTAKGCIGCHIHPDVTGGRFYGPDLTGKRFAETYLRKFLADPSITPEPGEICNRARTICGSPYAMPNLDLKTSEIEALVAFLNQKREGPSPWD